MSASTTSTHRWQILLGMVLTVLVALGSALVLGGALRGDPAQAQGSTARAQSATGQPPSTDCITIGSLVAAASTATASPAAARSAVDGVLSRARGLARTTASDDARESVQNLADDLAAYRVSVTHPGTDRHADVVATLRADLNSLRRLCGH
ncbi:MAG: hypothetical protein JF622_07575 [Terrabacter sp.]|nr:hypothetical protein [Terrabacter sp.]